MDRQQISSAVERYLAQRGFTPSARDNSVAAIVDRFIDAKRVPAGPLDQPTPTPAAPQSAPDFSVVDFVCEEDVRQAAKSNSKIYIGPRTIVTPAARDLAARNDTLILTDRVITKPAGNSNSE